MLSEANADTSHEAHWLNARVSVSEIDFAEVLSLNSTHTIPK